MSDLIERDIYEVANQLGGYVGPDTETHLAAFLLREAKEACKLADELIRLRDAIAAKDREIAELRAALQPVLHLEMWTESAQDDELCIMSIGTIRKMRSAAIRSLGKEGSGE